jgi:hypothetical protein
MNQEERKEFVAEHRTADLYVIVDDELWKPETFNDSRGLYAWGPAVPAEFILPADVAEPTAGA